MRNYNLKWAREHAGLTQGGAAKLIGVSKSTFTRWEIGTTPIPNHKLNRFLGLVGTTVAEVDAACALLPPVEEKVELFRPPGYDKDGVKRGADGKWYCASMIEEDGAPGLGFDTREVAVLEQRADDADATLRQALEGRGLGVKRNATPLDTFAYDLRMRFGEAYLDNTQELRQRTEALEALVLELIAEWEASKNIF